MTQALQPPLAQSASALSLTLPADGGDSEKCPRRFLLESFAYFLAETFTKQRLIPTCSGPVDEVEPATEVTSDDKSEENSKAQTLWNCVTGVGSICQECFYK